MLNSKERKRLVASGEVNVVFVEIGKAKSTVSKAIKQVKSRIPSANIYLISDQFHFFLAYNGVRQYLLRNLSKTDEWREFEKVSHLNRTWRNGFWYFTAERIFALCALIQQENLTNVLHFENDVILLSDFQKEVKLMQEVDKVWYPFENPDMGCLSTLFIKNKQIAHLFANISLSSIPNKNISC